MARAGLGASWTCLFANDIDIRKAASYAANWTRRGLTVDDVANLRRSDLPGVASLAWASFPCQDISLAGMGAGLDGTRSSSFWGFWQLMQALRAEGRAPLMIVLEKRLRLVNVARRTRFRSDRGRPHGRGLPLRRCCDRRCAFCAAIARARVHRCGRRDHPYPCQSDLRRALRAALPSAGAGRYLREAGLYADLVSAAAAAEAKLDLGRHH